ncbi:MAG: aldo/keto reductase [Sedimentisphaerales bacterium]|nr:aldo/keto reductase [Sedimentisphaerales bacterium]
MKKRILGRTGFEVSEISFGTVELGIPYGFGVKNQTQMPSEQKAIKLLHDALDSGINFFDTANAYGRSEQILGAAFKGQRQNVIISTKCGHLPVEGDKAPTDGQLREILDGSLKQSLDALQTDYIDVYMIHNATVPILTNDAVMRVFSEYKDKGLARAIGVSTYTVEQTRNAIDSGLWDVIQLPFNLMDQQQAELFPHAQKKGVGIVVRSVLMRGILTDRGRNMRPELKAVEQHRQLYNELLSDDVAALSDLATKFVLSHKDVSSVLLGIDRPEYLQKALEVANGKYLTERKLAWAKELAYPEPGFLDLVKWDRNGWLI